MAPPRGGSETGLVIRTISAIVVAIPTFAAVYFGYPFFDLVVALLVLALSWEWSRLCCEGQIRRPFCAALILSCLAVLALSTAQLYVYALVMAAAGAASTYGLARAGGHPHAGLGAVGVLYIGLPSIAFIWLRYGDPDGRLTIFWLVLTVIATDIGAFAAGRAFGGPRLAPSVSPKKTWSGLAGGVLLAVVMGGAMSWMLDGRAPGGAGPVALAAASAGLAVVSQLGDLLESSVKRYFGVKDMGAIIPGHGGVFDRFDGHLAAAAGLAGYGLVLGGDVFSWR